MLRSLTHYWRLNVAVVVAVAVCGAVFTGALLVGDSIRGSLRDLTLDRLGDIDLALVAERFFDAELATQLAAVPEFANGFQAAVPTIMLRGNALHAETRARASQINVLGIDRRFVDLFAQPTTSATFRASAGAAADALDFSRAAGQVFPSIIINEALRDELGAQLGDALLVHFRLGSEVPRDSVLGSRESADVVGTLRAIVTRIIADRGIGRFGLSPHQNFPLNAFVSLPQLQAAVDQPGRVNALLVTRRRGFDADPQPMIEQVVGIEDLGLEVRLLPPPSESTLEVQSGEFVLRQELVDAVIASADALGAPTLPLQSYLANGLRRGDRLVPFSMALALDNPAVAVPFGQLRGLDGSPLPSPGDGELLLNHWAAEDLGASVGDRVEMSYYAVGLDEQLRTEQTELRVAGIVAMESLAVDPELTPAYPGIEGVDDISGWDPPFPVDLDVIRGIDEQYWDEYRGAPKAFVSAATGKSLWSTRYGAVTSIRIGSPPGAPDNAFMSTFSAALMARLSVRQYGFQFLDVKRVGLDAAGGATDFGGLFIGFSFFLILSAVMIVGLLFALGIQARARQIGTLLALGYPLQRVRRQMLAEGMFLAALGSVLGVAGSVLYGRLLMIGLTTLWLPAVGSPLLYLHVLPATLALGGVLTVSVVGGSIWWTLRRLRRVPVTRLLAGTYAALAKSDAPKVRRNRVLAVGCAAVAVALLGYGLGTGAATSPALAFGIGAALLVSGLSSFSLWCRASRGRMRRPGLAAAVAMATRNSGWSPGRSILSVALVACACFVIVTVAGNTRDPEAESATLLEGAGGYTLMASTDVPVHHDLNDAASRFDLGFSDAGSGELDAVSITQLRLLPGDDASCLNLYSPQRPRVLGVPRAQIERGGFGFGATLADEFGVEGNAWELLDVDLGPGIIPAIGDANSTQWIMHVGLGDDVLIENERGEPLRLRIVATVRESIFQSELLISEANFLDQFPSQSGFSYFLIDAPTDNTGPVALLLEDSLSQFGFDTTSTATKIAGYLMVQNTYLSTFQMLGGLGLLLGTVGLGIVLVRNVIERRGELATLRAFGFRRAFLSRMVLIENAFLLAIGVTIGSLSALIAIAPRYLLGAMEVPWGLLLPTLGAVLAVGMLASIVAVYGALRTPLLPALKAER